MTKMKKFIVVVVGASALTTFNAQAASAAECKPEPPFPTPDIVNDPGIATLPFSYETNSGSASMQYSWRMLPEGVYPLTTLASGGPGSWKLPIVVAPRDGSIQLLVWGQFPSELAHCTVQVRNAVANLRAWFNKKGKLVVAFDRRRSLDSAVLTVVQKGKKTVRATSASTLKFKKVNARKSAKVTLDAVAADYTLPALTATAKPKKKRKK